MISQQDSDATLSCDVCFLLEKQHSDRLACAVFDRSPSHFIDFIGFCACGASVAAGTGFHEDPGVPSQENPQMHHSFTSSRARRRWVAILLAGLTAWGLASAQTSLRVATEGTYPPWSFKDSQGVLQGWDVDIAHALCQEMKVMCEVVAQDWDGIIPGLMARKYDMIVASMAITEARRQRVDFSDKYKETVSRFVAKKGTSEDVSPAGLRDRSIGVQRGSIQANYLAKNYPAAHIKFYDTPQAAELDLVAGRVDYILGNMVTYHVGFLQTGAAANFSFVGPDLKGGLLGDGNGIAVRKGDHELLTKVNAALAAIRANGTYDRITAKYFPFKLM